MHKTIRGIGLIAVLALAAACAKPQLTAGPAPLPEISVIPQPLRVERQAGSFLITYASRIAVPAGDAEAGRAAAFLAERLKGAFGLDLKISDAPPVEASGLILLRRSERSELGPEGYELSITPSAISIDAPQAGGLFYGVQTLFQLLPEAVYGNTGASAGPAAMPCLRIEDRPRLPWRGLLLDCSRHFFPKDFIKSVLDDLAMHKMNVFHWHLTDDQGWRIEIKKYPRLTEVGAWRVDREDKPWNERPARKEGEPAAYGGFYTQDDIREVVAYAAARGITIVPEIEMPGHCLAALAAHPELSCSGGPFTVPPGGVWPIKDVYCAGNDAVFEFLQNVLSEVVDLFPGTVIHVGGDEVDKSTWKKCPKCQARMAAEGLRTEEELQSWFIRKIEAFLNAKGKTLMGWDEILEGGLAPNAEVMSWRGFEGGTAAAQARHRVVMTPTSHCYFDYYQGPPSAEPPGIGGFLPLSKVYEFEPVPDVLGPEEAAYVIGAQANLWTEYVPNPGHAQYMLFPRLAAMAEVGWSSKTARDWEGFLARMVKQYKRYAERGVRAARSAHAVQYLPQWGGGRGVLVRMAAEAYKPEIRYTVDGAEPGPQSFLYLDPIRVERSQELKAGIFSDGRLIGPVTGIRFKDHRGFGKQVLLDPMFSPRYSAGGVMALTDGLRGTNLHSDGRWQGFEGTDMKAAVDLGGLQPVRKVTARFLQNQGSWIFWPVEVEFAVSLNNVDYRSVGTITTADYFLRVGEGIREYAMDTADTLARYIRVTAKSMGVLPGWHPSAGGKVWLMADEIIID